MTYLKCTHHGFLEVMKRLNALGADVNALRGDGVAALHLAVANNQVEAVKKMLKQGADLNIKTHGDVAPVYTATEFGHIDVLRALLDEGADANSPDANDFTSLHAPSREQPALITELLVQEGANPNCQTNTGNTPLHEAVGTGNLEAVEALIKHGAVITSNRDGWTPLHYAAEDAAIEIAKSLLDHGADINARNKDGWTSLHMASDDKGDISEEQCLETIKLLLEHGAVYCSNDYGIFPLHTAAAAGYIAIVDYYVDHGCSVNELTQDGETPLHSAIHEGRWSLSKHLISLGVNTSITDGYGCIPLHLAAEKGNIDLVKALLATRTCNINARSDNGSTPLQTAIWSGQDDIIHCLIEAGADLFAASPDGIRNLDYLRLLRPNLKVVKQRSQQLDEDDAHSQETAIGCTVQEYVTKAMRTERKTVCMAVLADYLLSRDMEDDAKIACEQMVLLTADWAIYCDGCDLEFDEYDGFFVCKTCAMLYLCTSCIDTHQEQPFRISCHDHEFIKVLASEAKFRPDDTEAFNQWLDGVLERCKELSDTEGQNEDYTPSHEANQLDAEFDRIHI